MKPEEYERMAALAKTHWWFAGKRALVERLVRQTVSSEKSIRKVVDLGCGTGANFSVVPPDHGLVLVGLDRSTLALDHALKSGSALLAQGDLQRLPLKSESVDLVLALDVFYHQWVKDDAASLQEVRRILRPGGVLIWTDSAFNFLKSSHDEAVFARYRYTRGDVRRLLAASGFDVVRTTYFNFFLFPFAVLWRKIFSRMASADSASDVRPLPPPLNGILTGILKAEAWVIDRGLSFPFGLSVVGVGRRKINQT